MTSHGSGRVPQRFVCPWRLREIYNAADFEGRDARGELMTDIISSAPPAPGSNEPPGTLSQRLRYSTPEGRAFAVVHRYLRPDGTIGGRGRSDPEILFTPSERLDSAREDTLLCPDCPPHIRHRVGDVGQT